MVRNIKNSSGKITGITTITDGEIKINNIGKPLLSIKDKLIINEVINNVISEKTLRILYNEYTMSIGEIASLYNRCYSNINKLIKKDEEIVINHCGRRNRAYGHSVSESQSKKMSEALKGRAAPQYERTAEMRKKISESLKQYYQEHPKDPRPNIEAWKRGIYDNVDFKKGIGGHFTSLKTGQSIRFRSLLELYYLLLIEQDKNVTTYKYESVRINMDNGRSYMPDFLINNHLLVELKAKKYVERVIGVKEKVEYKKNQAINYCKNHGLDYKIIYDEDIGFDSAKMKHYIKNNQDIVKKYNITFTNPKRMVLK